MEFSCEITGNGTITIIWMPLRDNLQASGNQHDCCVNLTNIMLTRNSDFSTHISGDQLCPNDEATMFGQTIELCSEQGDQEHRLELSVSFVEGVQEPNFDCNADDEEAGMSNDGDNADNEGGFNPSCSIMETSDNIDSSMPSLLFPYTTQSAASSLLTKPLTSSDLSGK